VPIVTLEVDIDHHDFAELGIDEQVLDVTKLAAGRRVHGPAADIGLSFRNFIVVELLQSNEPSSGFGARTNARFISHSAAGRLLGRFSLGHESCPRERAGLIEHGRAHRIRRRRRGH
jgi:hypothetical protein